jgi:hypothetical protein
MLLDAGAVLYCKTNVSTAMMITESVNNTFGRTVNPRNRSLTTGGSSGGEAALIAFGGSRIGIGSDIGRYQSLELYEYRKNKPCKANRRTRWLTPNTSCLYGSLCSPAILRTFPKFPRTRLS